MGSYSINFSTEMEISKRGVILYWVLAIVALSLVGGLRAHIIVFIILIIILPLCGILLAIISRRQQKRRREAATLCADLEIGGDMDEETGKDMSILDIEEHSNPELQSFTYERVVLATNDFSDENKLGQGGFGPVYKGKLDDQEVALKRLSRNSGQGEVEFMNEAKLIAKLQHTNLVSLIGCCTQKGEKILIYEYMPNRSLDCFLFDSEKRNGLDWKKRLNIIEGIAQGLLYLHKYSRLKIVHRDLKAGNILLDNEMNPKISDFGLARIYETKESQVNTQRLAGTFGYMAPEYALRGNFSPKSDVYSFGVLLLEILSGRRSNSFYQPDDPINLVKFAWNLWTENRGFELIDPSLHESCRNVQLLRCIHIGLLCVQDSANDRPSISEVLSMINHEGYQLRMPKEPAFYDVLNMSGEDVSQPIPGKCSLNGVSISEIEPR